MSVFVRHGPPTGRDPGVYDGLDEPVEVLAAADQDPVHAFDGDDEVDGISPDAFGDRSSSS